MVVAFALGVQWSPVAGRDEGCPVVGMGVIFAFQHVALGHVLSSLAVKVDSVATIKNPAASGRGMKQPLFEFFRRPKGRGIYP